MNVVQYTKERSEDLAEYLLVIANQPLSFRGEYPLEHSSFNHVHLWKLEFYADKYKWINAAYKVEFIEYIFDAWKIQLKNYHPYKNAGYRLYLYEDLAPTVSVVAETKYGCPYGRGLDFANSIEDIIALYNKRSWKSHWDLNGHENTVELVLKVIDKNNGSIGKPSAEQLGLSVGRLRTLIMQTNIANDVNKLRRKYKRRPADLEQHSEYYMKRKFYEVQLPSCF